MKRQTKSSVLRKTFPFLKIVTGLPPKSRKRILKELNGDKDIYKSMREIAVNTLNGNVPLSSVSKKKLKPHLKVLH